MPDRILIALGGNAFVTPGKPLTMAGQFRFAGELAAQLAPLFGQPADRDHTWQRAARRAPADSG